MEVKIRILAEEIGVDKTENCPEIVFTHNNSSIHNSDADILMLIEGRRIKVHSREIQKVMELLRQKSL